MESGRGVAVPILSRWHQSGEVDFEEETDTLGEVRGGNHIAGVPGCTEFFASIHVYPPSPGLCSCNGGKPRPLG